jgi:hypothetical protein
MEPEEGSRMDERRLQRWLTVGSVVLVAVLAVSFIAVIRAGLSASH